MVHRAGKNRTPWGLNGNPIGKRGEGFSKVCFNPINVSFGIEYDFYFKDRYLNSKPETEINY
jgi:hypothetical protein